MQTPKQEVPKFNSYQIFLIVILALLQFTVVLDFMVLSPLGDVLMKSLRITPSGFGAVVSAYAFSAGASGILAAGFADRFDRKKMLLFFYAGFTIGTMFCALANSFWTLFAARIVTGLFGGVISSISLAIITDLFLLNQRGRVMGFVQMAFAASQVLGIPVGLYFANKWGWHAPFTMIVVLAVLIGLAIVLKMKPVNAHLAVRSDKNPFLHLWHTISNKEYLTGFSAIALLSVGGFMLMPFSSPFLINNVGITHEQLPLVFLFTGMASIVIMPVVGRLSDRINKFTLFTVGSVIAIIMVVIYTHLPRMPLWEVVFINMLLFMGIMSRMIPATTLNTTIPEMKDRGAYMSITSSLQQMAGGIGAVSAGLIVKQATPSSPLEHFDVLGYVVCAAILACIFLVYRVSLISARKAVAAAPVPAVLND